MDHLPTEILVQIMEHCRIPELAKLHSTCSRFERITQKWYGEKTYSLRFLMEESRHGQTKEGEWMMEEVLKAEVHTAFPMKTEKQECKEKDVNKWIQNMFNKAGNGSEIIFSKVPITAELLQAIMSAKFDFRSVKTLQLLDCSFELDLSILLSFFSQMKLRDFRYSNDCDIFIDINDLIYSNLACNLQVSSSLLDARCYTLTDVTLESLKQKPQRYFQIEGIHTRFTLAKILELIEFAIHSGYIFNWNFGIIEKGLDHERLLEMLIESHLPIEHYTETDEKKSYHAVTSRNSQFKFILMI